MEIAVIKDDNKETLYFYSTSLANSMNPFEKDHQIAETISNFKSLITELPVKSAGSLHDISCKSKNNITFDRTFVWLDQDNGTYWIVMKIIDQTLSSGRLFEEVKDQFYFFALLFKCLYVIEDLGSGLGVADNLVRIKEILDPIMRTMAERESFRDGMSKGNHLVAYRAVSFKEKKSWDSLIQVMVDRIGESCILWLSDGKTGKIITGNETWERLDCRERSLLMLTRESGLAHSGTLSLNLAITNPGVALTLHTHKLTGFSPDEDVWVNFLISPEQSTTASNVLSQKSDTISKKVALPILDTFHQINNHESGQGDGLIWCHIKSGKLMESKSKRHSDAFVKGSFHPAVDILRGFEEGLGQAVEDVCMTMKEGWVRCNNETPCIAYCAIDDDNPKERKFVGCEDRNLSNTIILEIKEKFSTSINTI